MIHIGRAQAYCANGNMTGRTVGSSYTLTYDVENRLTGVSGGASATVGNSVAATYDGDGNRVKGVAGGVTTYYVGNYYEYVGGAVKKYYYHAGKRVAMYDGATLNWLLGEHLGSTTVTANSSGTRTGEIRYKAYGNQRYTYGTTPTTYHFTGQREESTIGLYYYGARWYDPALGRFVQADSIVPQPEFPHDLNRYAYGLNNPVKFTDPTGHYYYDPSIDALVYTRERRLEHPEYTYLPTAEQMTNPFGAILVQEMLIPEGHETAIGWRGEVSWTAPQELGLDVNVEILYKKNEGIRFFATFSGGYSTPGSTSLGAGFGITTGPLVVTNLSNLGDYTGPAITVGGTAKLKWGLEVDVASPDLSDPNAPQAHYIGFGTGIEGGGYVMGGETQLLTTWIHRLGQLLGFD